MICEKSIDIELATLMQKHGIAFTRIKNSNFKGKLNNFHTFELGNPFQCDRFVADFIIFHGGKTWLVEDGIKKGQNLSNKKQKEMQRKRAEHWEKVGNCYYQVLTSIDEVHEFFKTLLKTPKSSDL